jgi:hypothetical protein
MKNLNSNPHPGLQPASTPITAMGEHTAIPNMAPAFGAAMGTPASITGDKAQTPGTRDSGTK